MTLVEGSLGRNDPTGAWEYPPPPDLSPENLDWDTWQGNGAEEVRLTRKYSRAGAAGRNTGRGLQATCWCIS